MVDIMAFFIPNLSCRTAATGAMQLVVQEALDTICCLEYLSLFTPIIKVGVTPLSLLGAEITTFFAPARRWAAAFSEVVNLPVDSKTTSTSKSFHGKRPGSFSAKTGTFFLSTFK